MFRSRRSVLVKRLWKSRIVQCQNETSCPNETACPEDLEVKSVAQSMLKRLKEKQLEILIQSVESKGGETTECVLLPKGNVRLGRRGCVAPNVLCCQIWRWPDVPGEHALKRLPCCPSVEDPTSVCCNPYHWSRLLHHSDSSPSSYQWAASERVFIKQEEKPREKEVVSTETGGTPTAFRLVRYDGSGSNSSFRQFWCNIAYWELRQRVGRLFTVFEPGVNVFQELPHGDGMCLGTLQTDTNCESIRRTRDKIGLGLTLSKEGDGVWAYNRSDYPVFVNSPTLDMPNSRTLVVTKVQPGYSIKIFDYDLSKVVERNRDPRFLEGPYDPNSIRISFAKGWGPCYSRQFVTSCPCWIEVLLCINR